jgi:hypothetical protein
MKPRHVTIGAGLFGLVCFALFIDTTTAQLFGSLLDLRPERLFQGRVVLLFGIMGGALTMILMPYLRLDEIYDD